LNFKETKALINFRLKQASEEGRASNLFTFPAYWSIFKLSGGRPRKIIQLCHKLLLSMIIQNRSKINSAMVKACFHATELPGKNKQKWAAAILGIAILIFVLIFSLNFNWKKQASTQMKVQDIANSPPSVSVKSSEAVSNSEPVLPVSVKTVQTQSRFLGKINISRGETVNSLIASVYNVNTGKIFREVAEANPRIKNMNRVNAGEEINFPSIQVTSKILPSKTYRIKYSEFDQLEKAYQAIRKLRYDKVPVKLASFSDNAGKIKFAVISNIGYPDEDAASRAINPSMKGSAIINLDKNKIYYSDLN
jgi:general secretion pathway protein A